MPYRPRLMIVAFLVALIGGFTGCQALRDPQGAAWRRDNDIAARQFGGR
jgi:hypothetical protein